MMGLFIDIKKFIRKVKNLEKNPENWYYRTNPVEYALNSQQFRTKEFKVIDWKNSIVLIEL